MVSQGVTDSPPPHGGATELVDRTLDEEGQRELPARAGELPKYRISDADLATLHRLGDGTLTPIEGPMDSAVYHRVLDEEVIESNGVKYAWTIPVIFPATDEEAASYKEGDEIAIVTEAGDMVGSLQLEETYPWNKARYITAIYGTERTDHPGARIALEDPRERLLAGKVRVIPEEKTQSFAKYLLSPREARALFAEKKWKRIIAFQTRNPLHRAHEYAMVWAIEKLTRAGDFAGVVLNPLVGQLKSDDVPAATRMACYEELVVDRLLGEGDKDAALWGSKGYDINDVFELVGIDIKMFYGGPAEAVMHAIYRQNYGFSDIIIGRKHADAPYDDGTDIWGDFDAQEKFDRLAGELAIRPVKVGFAAYYEELGHVGLIQEHKDRGWTPVTIAGRALREMLKKGEIPDPRVIRPSVSRILIEHYTREQCAGT